MEWENNKIRVEPLNNNIWTKHLSEVLCTPSVT